MLIDIINYIVILLDNDLLMIYNLTQKYNIFIIHVQNCNVLKIICQTNYIIFFTFSQTIDMWYVLEWYFTVYFSWLNTRLQARYTTPVHVLNHCFNKYMYVCG